VVEVSNGIHSNAGEDEITCPIITHTLLLKESKRFDGFFLVSSSCQYEPDYNKGGSTNFTVLTFAVEFRYSPKDVFLLDLPCY
jgi:hypothetical protein